MKILTVHFTGEDWELDYLLEAIDQSGGFVADEKDVEDE